MGKTINIIGAGIAGQSAGCYLQMNGYDTKIFELHKTPGGLCTSWKRKDYIIDGCIHWLVGSSPSDNFYYLWNELVDMSKLEFVDHEEYLRVEDKNGKYMRVFTDVNRLEKEMLEKAPEDRELIMEFINSTRKLLNMNMPIEKASELMNLWDGIKIFFTYLPYLGKLRKYVRISAREFAEKCRNDLLKNTFLHMFIPEMSVIFLMFTIAWMHKKSAGYPIGGSLNFSRLIEKRYLDLGGHIKYGSKVRKIITENDIARGISLENGEIFESDITISAADGHFTIFEMLEGKYVDSSISGFYDNYEIFPSYVQISIGVSKKFDDEEPNVIVLPLAEPIMIDESVSYDFIFTRIMKFDPTLAPEGKTVVIVMYPTANYEYWTTLRQDDAEKYKAEKDRIAENVIDILDKRYGDIKSNVEVIDVSTPATVMRYTNNWKGSFEGWLITPKLGFKEMKKTLPGLSDFYMAGQWVQPGGGLPGGIRSGRNVAQIICKKDKRNFTTTHF